MGGLVAAVAAAASAQAASNKPYTANVHQTLNTANSFTLTLTNDPKASQSLGSANFTAPAGFALGAVSHVTNSGFTVSVSGSVVQFRAKSSSQALGKSQSVSADVAVTISACTSATWSVEAKQSNDFSGQPGNDMTLNPASDLTPLGSFEIADIGTTISTLNGSVFAPAIQTNQQYASTTTAYDTCHHIKTEAQTPLDVAYSGAALTHTGLHDDVTKSVLYDPTGGQTLSWTNGNGTVKITPVISETNNTITVTDPTTGISDTSNFFDTQDRICTSNDSLCTWSRGNSINASAHGPAQGSLGVGFNPVVPFTCGDGNTPLGNAVITIAPHGTSNPGDHVPYQVTLVYSKQTSGTGSANAFVFCESIDEGVNWGQLPSCADTDPLLHDCVFDQKRVTGGALQVILSLVGDPYVGGK
ncbi:MAG TPA: hypothetical protein VGF72_02275 [Gaiellaceae bacterium]